MNARIPKSKKHLPAGIKHYPDEKSCPIAGSFFMSAGRALVGYVHPAVDTAYAANGLVFTEPHRTVTIASRLQIPIFSTKNFEENNVLVRFGCKKAIPFNPCYTGIICTQKRNHTAFFTFLHVCLHNLYISTMCS
ncbi:hypothetical protein SAMN05518683_109109 [Salibacterium halotolerans]|uniref:Uncharacterized protein n=1 Tax=Salibacterium halotolerans TaxID=1884432 RepID=A0A1I5SWR7_9BACI|nr:hypothetical protein SAMN05518683_109109 [Salibacterium halotolerans]